MQNRNLKLGLCGLALTSFLAVNTHSVVHADTVSDSNVNNNAITWDSDNDDSQVVKEEPQRVQPTQPVQAQAPTVQPVQKQATVQLEQTPKPVVQVPKQSTIQASQSQPVQTKKIMVSDVSSTPVSQKRAETSTVRASNFDSRAVNQVRVNNTRPQAKVANVNATVKDAPVQITNPQNNQVIVHYVKSNGQSAGLADQTIDVTKVGKGQYAVPSGYALANNGYTNSTTEIKQANVAAGANNVKLNQVTAEKLANMIAPKINDVPVRVYLSSLYAGGDGNEGGDGHPAIGLYVTIYKHMKNSQDVGYTFLSDFPTVNQEWGTTPFTTDNIQETEVSAYEYSQHVNLVDNNAISNLQSEIASGDGTYSKLTEDDCVNILNWLQASFNNDWVPESTPTLYKEIKMSNTISVPVFTDNSGQVKSVVGNHVNIVVTQPVAVNDASQTRKTAERIISVNLPNVQGVRDRYKGILNNNNQIVQTITFTRAMTKDNLTGTVLSQSAWQGPSSFPAVTLPDIPGYTMTMN